jgi:hypothetical protein
MIVECTCSYCGKAIGKISQGMPSDIIMCDDCGQKHILHIHEERHGYYVENTNI